ncbi:50S ribosomal protein L21 [Candidatus Roizmanbacteria bacterium RIFCSPLOWO2_01_FULL_38_12]|uniref:50S ribosomal protein L21 n=1 Tax=Candidatus Roizmanbacteria bacterium RIFCSPLOWO2_01_FULL_38_12 TaxID=1802061 RepID=A0A1F7J0N5_9BACT|nr:MAG: 50S ribosomal protein L21 [Candidatus Roizmanbacteria bacterium RIFCSPHIGHO2_01_FULL_38_15]OGK36192.1 MAG: 50S ribosomal protein L21 [Candidatus Roizmanbacteria bacterium RIFCSPHIGHO2_12_FULL_38_13]OGK49175.1 MAG: 50S ribosomal protein L21 [Candidatus Roizmanbacteria bacterium RIFCSPLOWO2_01_FULL_38_12]
MNNGAIVQIAGKQYLVHKNDELIVDELDVTEGKTVEARVLMSFDKDEKVTLGTPELKNKAKLEVISHLKGDKIRVAKFKSKVRYRKVRGFRPRLSKVKVVEL